MIRKRIPAKETAEPEYQKRRDAPDPLRLEVAVLWVAVITRVVVAGEPEETFKEEDDKERFALMVGSVLMENETGPLKLFAGVTVKVIPPAVAPEVT
jgi:hypothetical protein